VVLPGGLDPPGVPFPRVTMLSHKRTLS
jgi:hypothetical protein